MSREERAVTRAPTVTDAQAEALAREYDDRAAAWEARLLKVAGGDADLKDLLDDWVLWGGGLQNYPARTSSFSVYCRSKAEADDRRVTRARRVTRDKGRYEYTCQICEKPFRSNRRPHECWSWCPEPCNAGVRHCSDACKQRAYRQRKALRGGARVTEGRNL